MFSRSTLKAAAQSSRHSAFASSILFSGKAPRVSLLPDGRRSISMYGYTQAKALVYSKYGEPKDVLRLHKHSISAPHGTQVNLRLLTAPMNPADVNQIQGVYPGKPPFDNTLGTGEPAAVGGNEGAFELIRIEDKEGLTPLQVGTVSVNPVTAYRMIRDFCQWDMMRTGEEWLIQNGANSGVGRAAIQLGREWGIKTLNVIRQRNSPEETDAMKQELKDLGATAVVTEEELLSGGFRDMVKEITRQGREPIRLALNCVGGKNATALAKTLAPDSHMVTYGAMSKQPVALPSGLLIFKNLAFDGFWVSRWGDKNPQLKENTIKDVLQLTRAGRFKDIPVDDVKWNWNTEGPVLAESVQGTLGGFRSGKGVFTFTGGDE
ncbi:hypothetical protein N7470_006712 [Penicillium chermesinum]|nr:hypothetical protein N7470_006712 [Penicillium chermesinum]